MRALLKISWREVKEGFTKFLLTLLSVSLGVAFLTGTLALRDTLANTFNSIVTSSITSDVFVRGQKITEDGPSSARHMVDLNLEDEIRTAVGPDALIEPALSVPGVTIEDANGDIIRNSGAPTLLLAYEDSPLNNPLSEGRWPKGPREIVVNKNALTQAGLKIGDTTNITINGSKRQVTITGSLDWSQSTFGAIIILMERDVVEPLALPDVKKVGNIGIKFPEGTNIQEQIKKIAKVVPANTVVVSADVLKKESEETIETQLGFVNIFLLVFVFISLFVGSFVIGNTFAMTVRQRLKQFAMLRAIGVKPGGIFFLVLIQAIVLGFLGSLLGIMLGIVILFGIGAMFQSIGLPLDTPTMSGSVMVTGIIVGILVTIGGAIVSARKAALTNPLEVLRDAQGAERAGYTWRNYLSLAALVIGVILLAVGASGDNFPTIGAGAVITILGVLGSLTFMAGPIVRTAGKLLRPLGKVETRLAIGNIMRNKSRTAATAGALFIGVALVVAGSMISSSVREGSSSLLANNYKADLAVAGMTSLFIPRQEIDRVKAVENVEQVAPLGISEMDVIFDGDRSTQNANVVVNDITSYRTHTVLEGDADALSNGRILINQPRLPSDQRDAYEVDDELTLETPYGKKKVKVGALVDAPAMDFTFIIPWDLANELDPGAKDPVQLDVKIDEDADLETVKRDINALFDENAPYKAWNVEELSGEAGKQLDTILGILYGLLALSVITAIFGIINTLALSVMDRTREIGMSQAIGMRAREVIRMVTFEGILTTVIGAIAGVVTGITLAWALLSALDSYGINSIVMPWGTIVGVLVGALVIGVAAAMIPARNAAKINVLSAMAE